MTSYYQKLFLSHTRCWLCTISTYEALLLNFNPTFYIYIWIQIKWILQVCIVLLSLFQSLSLMKIVSETLQKFHIFCNSLHRGVRAGSAKKSGKKMINFKFFEKIYTHFKIEIIVFYIFREGEIMVQTTISHSSKSFSRAGFDDTHSYNSSLDQIS